MLFISFYTTQGKYPAFAEKLEKSLQKFQLDYHIHERKPFETWEAGCRFKPQFILDCLLKYRTPVVWLDVDAEVWRFPQLLFGKHDFAIYNWYADNDHHLAGKIAFDPNSTELMSSSGVVKFGYSLAALELLVRWNELAAGTAANVPDDPILDLTFKRYRPRVCPLWLPKVYNRMDKHTEHWRRISADSVVINHDYSSGAHRTSASARQSPL